MIGLWLPDVKLAAAHIFTRSSFDGFLLKEAVVTTSNTYIIDGTIKKDYFLQEELEQLQNLELMEWKSVRPVCFSLIRGTKLPLSFRISFALPKDHICRLLWQSTTFQTEEVGGFYLNFLYEKRRLSAVSAISLKSFSMDQSLEQLWDDTVIKLFHSLKIPCGK